MGVPAKQRRYFDELDLQSATAPNHRDRRPFDDSVISRILATGATPTEVLEAFTWATADDQIGTELRHGRSGIAGEVYEILMQEEPDPEELRG
jgi:hypothetical protein